MMTITTYFRRACCIAACAAMAIGPTCGSAAVRHDDPAKIRGAIYVPAEAYNAPQMWKDFDPAQTSRDLDNAKALHLNALRVWASYEYWKANPDRFGREFDQFLAISRAHDIRILVSLFENDGVAPTPANMWTKDPSQAFAIQSPGRAIAAGPALGWEPPRQFIQWFMKHFGNDDRLLAIEVMNEPSEVGENAPTVPFAKSMFASAKSLQGSVPLTVGTDKIEVAKDFVPLGLDVIQFHDNFPLTANELRGRIEQAMTFGKSVGLPVWLTEWQRIRPGGSGWGQERVNRADSGIDYASLASVVREYPVANFFWSLMVKRAYLKVQRFKGTVNGLFWSDGSVASVRDARAIAGEPGLSLRERQIPEDFGVVQREDAGNPSPGTPGSTANGAPSRAVRAALDGALGANFNEHYEDVDFAQLKRSNDQWIRGFLTMPQVNLADPGAHQAITSTLEAEKRGFRTILTLKWPMKETGIPAVGSAPFNRAMAELDAILPLVIGKIDVLEIGNEPFIEAPDDERDGRLNAFYEAMAHRVIAYRTQYCPGACPTHLFMGALNRLNAPTMRTATTERWLEFVRTTPELDGVDIHPHVRSLEDSQAFLAYVLPRLRSDQKFIATEFSLVWYWKEHLRDRVPAAFAVRYGFAPNTLVWQAIGQAIASPYPQSEWDDFLTSTPWYASARNYLTDQMVMFRQTGRLAVATYGFKQGGSMVKGFGPESTPWLLNSVIASRTVQPHPDGAESTNPYWLAEFERLTTPRPADRP